MSNNQFTSRTGIARFTAYRRNISQRATHTAFQKNPDDEPQFEGVIWTDGTVSLRWMTACRSTSVWASIGDMLNIHGHPEYGTVIDWHDAPAPQEWTDQCKALLSPQGPLMTTKSDAAQASECICTGYHGAKSDGERLVCCRCERPLQPTALRSPVTTPAPVTVERLRELRDEYRLAQNDEAARARLMVRGLYFGTTADALDELLAARERIAELLQMNSDERAANVFLRDQLPYSPAVKQATACGDRCGGKRILSYINLSNPFAPAEHRKCPGCPDCGDTEGLVEALASLRNNIGAGLLTALRNGAQMDMDGCEVRVSRQACEEAADHLEQIAATRKGEQT